MPYNRTKEDREHLIKRVALAKKGYTHPEIDTIFENEKLDSLSLSELREQQRQLEQDRENLELEKQAHQIQVAETQAELNNLEEQIQIKKNVLDDCGETVTTRKIKAVMNQIEQDQIDDVTYCCFISWKNGKFSMKHMVIPKSQNVVVTECCYALAEQTKKEKGESA